MTAKLLKSSLTRCRVRREGRVFVKKSNVRVNSFRCIMRKYLTLKKSVEQPVPQVCRYSTRQKRKATVT